MSAFEKVIGYDEVKEELLGICDMIHHWDSYKELGAKMPNGVLLYGEPGLGKTLIVQCFIEESGLNAITVRKNTGENFAGYITKIFERAKESAPCIVFLDDMDKFANEDETRCDAEEYVAVQAGIDCVKDFDVFVIATVNDISRLPDSLTRLGRFDHIIELYRPTYKNSAQIIEYYLKQKKVAKDLNFDDIVKMLCGNTCAELETIMNEAAINAGAGRKTCIEIEDIIEAVLRFEYGSPDDYTKKTEKETTKIAYHEAGHLLMHEILCPESVGLASIRPQKMKWGFVRSCKVLPNSQYRILISLAGKAAEELIDGMCAEGCAEDIMKAYRYLEDRISKVGCRGFAMVKRGISYSSESMQSKSEVVVQAELERYMYQVREIVVKNKSALDNIAQTLLEKKILLASDIKQLMQQVPKFSGILL